MLAMISSQGLVGVGAVLLLLISIIILVKMMGAKSQEAPVPIQEKIVLPKGYQPIGETRYDTIYTGKACPQSWEAVSTATFGTEVEAGINDIRWKG